MPYEDKTYEVKLIINGKEVDSAFEIPFKENGTEQSHEEKVAKAIYERYEAFGAAGFDDKQAFSLTRDWFNHELGKVYDQKY